jgi:hypothetical protein
VTRDHHGHPFRDPRSDHIPHRCPSEVVEDLCGDLDDPLLAVSVPQDDGISLFVLEDLKETSALSCTDS